MKATALMAVVLAAVALAPASVLAQQAGSAGGSPPVAQATGPVQEGPFKYAVVFGAPGLITDGYDAEATVFFGGGMEIIWPNGLGFAVDGGYKAVPSGLEYGVFVLSPGVIYEFPLEGPTRPYLRGGYTLMFRGGMANLFHFGGGVNHWINNRLGIKFEVRDNVYFDSGGSPHFLDFLVGVNIRPGG